MKRAGLAILFPFVLLLGWTLSLGAARASGIQIRVPITGYDPRDLLSGHYIRFALATDGVECPTQTGEEACLCYAPEPGTEKYVPYLSTVCTNRPANCSIFVRGRCSWSRFVTGNERYSIPERLAPVLLTIPDDSSVVLSVDGNGAALVGQMYVGSETVEEYAEKKLLEAQNAPVATATP